MTATTSVRPGHHTHRLLDRAVTAVAIWSAGFTLLGLWWAFHPGAWPFRRDVSAGTVLAHVDPRLGAILFTAFAFAGLLAAPLLRRGDRPKPLRRLLFGVAVVEAIAFTVLVPDIRALAILGYALALTLPLLLAGFLVAGAIRHGALRVLLLVLAGVVAMGVMTGFANADVIAQLATEMSTGLAAKGVTLLAAPGVLVGGVAWTLVAVGAFRRDRGRCTVCGRPGAAWTRPVAAARWGRRATVVAALCPLPYALLRLTWLTPWPLGFTAQELADAPAIRLFGLCLGLAALAGAVLTTGLVSRWGERWPFWVPRLAGRAIPWQVAVVPAAVVTFGLAAAAQNMTVLTADALRAGDTDTLYMFGVLPFGIWAPALGAATLAYWYRRRGTCGGCGAL